MRYLYEVNYSYGIIRSVFVDCGLGTHKVYRQRERERERIIQKRIKFTVNGT